jgi:ABC-type multidrug transport system ATPase subunit
LVIVEASNLCCQLRDGGISDVTFSVNRGERFCVFGDSGSGKSVLLSLISGRLQLDEGEIRVLGQPPSALGPRIALAPHLASEPRSATARQHVQSALAAARVPASQRPARLAEALHAAGLYERADRSARDLNYAALVSLQIALAAAHRPDLLLIDDLLRLLPPVQRRDWWEYMDNRRHVDGCAVVYATMDSDEAEAADRVLVLDHGRVIGCDRPDLLLNNCAGEEIRVEAADSERVERTLRGIPEVEAISSHEGTRFCAADGAGVAGRLFRHPAGTVRAVFVRRPTLWDYVRQSRLR